MRLFLTDNRRSMVSARSRPDGRLEVRLQRCFLDAPPEALQELGELLAGRDGGRRAMREFLDRRLAGMRAPAASRPVRAERLAFRRHDLAGMAARLNAFYLGGRSRAAVAWGRRGRTGGRRSIRFGCYDRARNLIIMNRKLDSDDIPPFFVEYILFHEMLHEVLGEGLRPDGKRDIHGRLFKLMESTYPDYDKAVAFEKEICRRMGIL
ncbi:MAG: hypothetical protein LBU23_08695 [Planctomycetota bacterium]|nr:hypothetical protein [Planctomycetota bacterium]